MIHVLISLILVSLYCTSTARAQRNLTLRFGDPALTFLPGRRTSTAQAPRSQFLLFNDIAVALEADISGFASKIIYTGLKRTGGAQYGVCLNCNDSGSILVFDGHDDNLDTDSQAIPTTIFELSLNPNRANTLTLINLPDNRFGGDSQLTFDSLTIMVDDGNQSASSILSSTSSSSASATLTRESSVSNTGTMSSLTSATSTTLASSSQNPTMFTPGSTSTTSASSGPEPVNAASNARNSIIAIISIFVVLGIASLLVGLSFYLRRRSARRKSRMPRYPFNPAVQSGTDEPLKRFPSIRSPSPYAPRMTTSSSPGPLAAAGRSRPEARLPDPYPYPFSQRPIAGPIRPNRRLEDA
ncbi:hypothetical protein WG66_015503 [Moniliophthora roreri]|nr:hypothetical protein WG66_015503 [Moniliophthora roreri]